MRRGVQIERMFRVIEIMRKRPSVTITDLQKHIRPTVSERTIRRDLEILTRLNWCVPVGDGLKTRWKWTKEE